MKKFLFFLFAIVSFTISEAQSVTITQPNGGEVLYGCQTYQIKWTASGVSNNWNIDYSLNSGAIWTSVSTNLNVIPSGGVYTYNWTVPMVGSTTVLARVRDYSDTTKQDVSNAVFTIQLPINITSPNGGETWQGLSTHTITWNPAGTSGVFNIYYSIDNGSNFISVATNVAANNYTWTVPNNPSTQALVKVTDATTACQLDLSNSVFTISPAQPILTSPNGGELWTIDATKNITWTASTFYTTVKLEYSTDNGTSYNLITSAAPNTGTYAWVIPNTPSTQVLVRASNSSGSTINDVSNATFTIQLPLNFLISPNGGEVWRSGNTHNITWDNSVFTSTVKIEYSINNGLSWTTVTAGATNNGTYAWTIPQMNSTTQALVKLTNNTLSTIVDTSNAVFTIKAPITVDYPNLTSDTVTGCSAINISWSKTTAFENYTYNSTCYSGTNDVATYQLYYSVGGSGTWNLITTMNNVCGQNSYSYSWTVPDLAPGSVRFRVIGKRDINTYGSNPPTYWQDSSDFEVPVKNPNGTIVVTNPNGGVTLNALANYNVTWTANGTSGFFDVLYSVNGGTSYNTVTSNVSGSSYTWNVNNNPSTNVYVRVRDNQNNCRKDASNAANTIIAATPILTAPNGGETWKVNSTQNITWTQNTLYTSVYIEYSVDNGANWNIVTAATGNSGSYAWTIPNTITTQALVRISNVGAPANSDVSNGVFTINLPTPLLTVPNGGEVWRSGNTHNITWDQNTVASNVQLEYSINNGTTWSTITASASNTGSYAWTVPQINTTTQALVRITNTSFPTAIDTSNAVFTIKAPITVDYPNLTSDTVTGCSAINISWSKTTAFENYTYNSTCYSGTNDVATYQLYYSVGGSGTWNLITTMNNVCGQNSYSYSWTVPDLAPGSVRFRVIGKRDINTYGSNPPTYWQDSSDFEVPVKNPNGTIVVTNPNGGVTLNALANYNVTWTANGTSGFFDVLYSVNGGTSYNTVTSNVSGSSYTWNVNNNPSTNVYVRVRDNQNNCRKDASNAANTIIAATPILTAPNGGETWKVNSTQNITWTQNTLYTSVYIEYSVDNGANWNIVTAATGNSGSYAWTIPNTITTQALVRISNVGAPANSDVSNGVFTINLPTPLLTVPNGGEVWRSGNTHNITWDQNTVASNVQLEYSINNGTTWSTITASASNTGSYAWTVPQINTTTQALVRITNTSFPTAIDTSNAVFTIKAPITVDYPNLTSDTVTGCSAINISWSKTTAFENYTYNSTCYSGTNDVATYQLYYSVGGSGTWNLITTMNNVCGQNSYSYSWTVPDLAPGSVRFRVIGKRDINTYGSNPPTYWQDSSDFEVPVKNPNGTIVVTNPNGGVTLNALANYNVTWTANGTSGFFDVLYSVNGGTSYNTVTSNVSGSSYTWNVNNNPSTNVYVRVRDNQNNCRKDASNAANTIIAATPILTAPNGGETWNVYSVQNITWQQNSLYTSAFIEYSTDNGVSWNTVVTSTSNTGSYAWTVPFTPSTQVLIRISNVGAPSNFDVSNAVFTIQIPTPVVTAPNGGETWYAGTSQNITWLPSTYFSTTVNLEYSLDSGITWVTIANNQTNNGTYAWTLPNVNSARALVKVSNSSNTAYYDVSNALLTLRPYLRLVSPNGGNLLGACTQTTITFEKAPLYTAFNLEYSTDNGATWTTIFSNQTYSSTVNTYNWTVPNAPSTQALIRVYPYTVLNRADTSDAVFTIKRAVTIIQPNFGGVLVVGSVYPVKWQSDGISNIYDIAYSTAGPSGPWTNVILGYNTATNNYNWTVPNTPSTNCYLRIRDNINSCKEDISDLAFTISTTANPITLVTPNGTDSLSACQSYNITWTESGSPIGNYNIGYSIDNGTNWIPIATNYLTSSGTYPWIVPNISAPSVLVRVQSGLNPLVFDYSDALFKINSGRLVTNNDTTICSGNSVQLNTTGGSSYSWTPTTYLTNPTIANPVSTPTTTTQYIVSSVSGGCSLSDTVLITVNASSGLTASVIITPSPGTAVCSGTNVLFTATPTNGGFSPSYQWKINNVNVGTNTYTYSSSSMANNDAVKVVMTSSQQCVLSPVSTSNIVTMTVFPNVTPSVTISTAQTTICAGANVTFTATPTNGGGAPVYQWKKNGVNVGTNANTYTNNSLSNNDVISVDMTSNANCATPSLVSSNSILMTVNPNSTPAITISASATSICTGTSVTFTANATNAGATPIFQWKKNGVNVGTNSSTFTTTTLANNDVITCDATSSATCNSISTVTSNSITMSVSTSVTPSVTVSPSATNVCAGTAVTFTATPTNGGSTPSYQWKVNGINAGTNSNTYSSSALANNDVITVVMTSSSGCASPTTATSTGITMTVNPTSAPTVSVSASTTSVCSGTNVLFTATASNAGSTPSYQWILNGANTGGNATTYNTSALANNDSVWCLVTSSSTCASPNNSASNHVVMTVNVVVTPSVSISTSSNNVCANTSVLFTAVPTNGGSNPAYQWKVNGTNVGVNSFTYSSTSFANNDVVTCMLTSNVACATTTTATSNPVTMTISPNTTPTVTIATGATTVCSGTPVTFTATALNAGGSPTYQWKKNGINVGTNSSTYSLSTLANNDAVSCVVTSSAACANPLTATSNTILMTVNTTVTPSVSISATNTSICAGQSITFTATPVNGGTTPAYQWKKNGTNVGTNSSTFTTTVLANNDVITCDMTSNALCASTTTVTSNSLTMTINTSVTPTISITASGTNICGGTSVTFNSSVTNGGGAPTYVWKNNGVAIGGATGTSYSTTTLTNGNVITCEVTSSAACASPLTVSSNSITMTVTSSVTASISISASATSICTGNSVTFTAVPTNGGSTPVYQWKVNGTNVGTNSTAYTSTTLNNNDAVTCVMTSNATCVVTASVTSNSISMIVNTPAAATVSITGGNTICAGTSAMFNATVTNAGSSPVYQWKVNGVNAGTNSSTFSTTTLANGDLVTCQFTSVNGCSGTNSANSNTITMSVTPSVTPDVSISASSTSICAGQNVTFTAAPTNGGSSPTYQWLKNGTVVGTNASTYSSTALINNDVVKVVLTSNAGCAVPATDTSNAITITVGSNATPTVSISASATTICNGTAVTFTATPANGGGAPSYQWKVNTTNAGTNSPSFTSSALVNGDVVTCIMTSNASCVSTTTATSNPITILVNTPVTPAVSISATATNICATQNVTFTASATNGGSTPAYQWKVNGNNAGTNSNIFSTTALANGDVVTVVMTSSATCPSVATATANPITITVSPSATPDVNISASQTTICSGTAVTFTATGTGGGTTPAYQWYRNTTLVGTNSSTFNTSALSNNDVITCVMTTNASCYTQLKDTSNAVTITLNTSVVPSVSISASATTICIGGSVTFTASATNGGTTPAYQWKVNTTNVGTNTPSFTSTSLNNGDVVTVIMTSNANCASPATATSNAVTIVVSSPVTPSVTVSPSTTNICAGASVTFTATPTNGGTTPSYQWLVNGNNSGTNAATFTTTTLANGDAVTVVMTSSASCPAIPTATSTPISVTVNPTSAPAISVSPSANNVCAGTSVTFTATPSNGGASPVYQWKVNNVNAGSNSAVFTSNTFNDGDVVTCVLTSSSTCSVPNSATSNQVTMNITPNVVPAITVSSSNSICSGSIATFTATITDGGAAPAYQWKLNNLNVGTSINSYSSSSLNNGDLVSCVLTSNANCASPTVVTSNQYTVNVVANAIPSITINASSTVICGGSSITFNALPTNGGSSPAYQWKLNGVAVGSNSSSYSNAVLANGDVVTCELTSNAACVSPSIATSNAITMSVGTSVTPSVNISATATNICSGTSVTVTATPTNGGTTPVYAWTVNGISSGANSTTFTTSTLSNNDVVACNMTSNAACASPLTVSSNTVTITVNSISQPTVSIVASQNPVCTGASVTFTATAINAGGNPVYTWKVNGTIVGVNSDTYTSSAPADGDVVICEVTSTASCTNGMVVSSNTVTLTVGTSLTASVSVSATSTNICSGTSVTFTATPVNGGPNPTYVWKINGTVAGTNSPTFTTTTLANNDVVTVELTSNATCVSGTAIASTPITVVVSASLTPAVNVTVVPSNVVCANTNVVFTASTTNGGGTPAYQWKLNSVNVGSNAITYSNNALTDGDVITVELTSSEVCATQPLVVSPAQTMTVNALPAAPTIAQNGNVLTSSAPGANQWVQGGAPISGATAQTYTAVTTGWYAVEATNANGCSSKSDSVLVTVTGIEEISINEAVKILPNPFFENFSINISNSITKLNTWSMNITDAFGRVVYSNRNVHYNTLIDLSEHAKGVYFVNITAGNEHKTFKVIKQE